MTKTIKQIMPIFLLVTFLLLTLTSNASANTEKHYLKSNPTTKRQYQAHYSAHWHAVAEKVGKRAPGRNIRKWGVLEKGKIRPATLNELKVSYHRLRNMHAPKPIVTTLTANAPSNYTAGGNTATEMCESGGNPQAISPGGTYRGLYQFDNQTWNAYKPAGAPSDPIAASVAQQRQAAANVPYAAWPNC